MSKKRKRQARRKKSTRSQSTSTSVAASRSARLRREFNPDYTYVIQDLRRIALLAGTFLVILVILSFFLG